MNILPPIGTSGVWSLKAPFDTKPVNGIAYTLISIRKLTDILNAGADPEALYYTPFAITHADYLNDLDANVSILSLNNASYDTIYVPSSYVNKYPDIGGIPYNVYGITAELGSLPESVNLDYLLTLINDVIRENIGIASPNAGLVVLGETTLVSAADSQTLEAARHANITAATTDHAKYLAAIAQRDAALVKLAICEQKLLALHQAGLI